MSLTHSLKLLTVICAALALFSTPAQAQGIPDGRYAADGGNYVTVEPWNGLQSIELMNHGNQLGEIWVPKEHVANPCGVLLVMVLQIQDGPDDLEQFHGFEVPAVILDKPDGTWTIYIGLPDGSVLELCTFGP